MKKIVIGGSGTGKTAKLFRLFLKHLETNSEAACYLHSPKSSKRLLEKFQVYIDNYTTDLNERIELKNKLTYADISYGPQDVDVLIMDDSSLESVSTYDRTFKNCFIAINNEFFSKVEVFNLED